MRSKRWRQALTGFSLVIGVLLLLPVHWWRPLSVNLSGRLQAPSWAHPLGTDALGRDMWGRLAAAVWESSLPLAVWVAVAACGGVVLGMALACWGERALHERSGLVWGEGCLHALLSVPFGLLVFLAAAWDGKAGFVAVAWVFAVLTMARFLLEVLQQWRAQRNLGYWQAHRVMGGSALGRLWRYGLRGGWLPSLWALLLYQWALVWSAEAALSYLGFGVSEPQASLGNILAMHYGELWRGQMWPAMVTFVYLAGLVCLPSYLWLPLWLGDVSLPFARMPARPTVIRSAGI